MLGHTVTATLIGFLFSLGLCYISHFDCLREISRSAWLLCVGVFALRCDESLSKWVDFFVIRGRCWQAGRVLSSRVHHSTHQVAFQRSLGTRTSVSYSLHLVDLRLVDWIVMSSDLGFGFRRMIELLSQSVVFRVDRATRWHYFRGASTMHNLWLLLNSLNWGLNWACSSLGCKWIHSDFVRLRDSKRTCMVRNQSVWLFLTRLWLVGWLWCSWSACFLCSRLR